jgi:hypothetical protein
MRILISDIRQSLLDARVPILTCEWSFEDWFGEPSEGTTGNLHRPIDGTLQISKVHGKFTTLYARGSRSGE